MKVVSEMTFKNKMAEMFRELEATGEELLITENGQMVLKIISYHRELIETGTHNQELRITL